MKIDIVELFQKYFNFIFTNKIKEKILNYISLYFIIFYCIDLYFKTVI